MLAGPRRRGPLKLGAGLLGSNVRFGDVHVVLRLSCLTRLQIRNQAPCLRSFGGQSSRTDQALRPEKEEGQGNLGHSP